MLAKQCGVDVISVANKDGINVFSSDSRLVGFRFSEDPAQQSFEFRKLIGTTDGIVTQAPRKRTIDNVLFKYIGISRKDEPGIIQVGFNAETLKQYELQVDGFAVVAKEVYRLAEDSRAQAKGIAELIKQIRMRINDSVKSMQASVQEVESG
jgi:methyl-accepting chemotaxis protein